MGIEQAERRRTEGRMNEEQPDLPWFPFWVADFIGSRTVRTMKPEEVGVYILLLASQWMDGPIPDEPEIWPALTNNADLNTVQAVLKRCFYNDGKSFLNLRLEDVRERQIKLHAGKVRAGMASAKARRAKKKEQRSNSVPAALEQPEPESDTEVKEKPPIVPQGGRAKKAKLTALPDDWEPTGSHRERADEMGFNLDGLVEDFRNHAEATGRRQASWNAAFTTWINRAPDMSKHRKRSNQTNGGHEYRPHHEVTW